MDIPTTNDSDVRSAAGVTPAQQALADRTAVLGTGLSTGKVYGNPSSYGYQGVGEGGSPSADTGNSTGVIGTGGSGNQAGVKGFGSGGGSGVVGTSGGGLGSGVVGFASSTGAGVAGFSSGTGAGVLGESTGTGAGGSFIGGSSSAGVTGTGGGAGGPGATFTGGAGNSDGVQGTGGGTGSGGHFTGGGSNGTGATCTGAGTGFGVNGTGGPSAGGCGVQGTGGAAGGPGGNFVGTGTGQGAYCTGAGSGAGVVGQGGATGAGGTFTGGATSGAGVTATGGPNSSGVIGTGAGSGNGADLQTDGTAFNPSTNRPLGANIVTGPVHVGSSGGVGVADPGPNNIWAAAIPKAWVVVATDGSGGISILSSYNVNSVGLIPTLKEIAVNFTRAFADANVCAIGVGSNNSSGNASTYASLQSGASTNVAYMVTGGDDPHATASTISFLFFGHQ